MQLLVGLGNPGPKYGLSRHNVGFMVVDEIARRHAFGPWRKRFEGLAAEGSVGEEKILALKPETYMNRSGRAVGAAARFYKLDPADIVVVHDEIDLAPGKIRFKQGGGHAGHNGIRDIEAHIGPDFKRVRIGVGHPGLKDEVTGHVLDRFSKTDIGWVAPLLQAVAEAFPALVAGGGAAFTNRLALLMAPRDQDAGGEAPETNAQDPS